jgi:hypothetical protein
MCCELGLFKIFVRNVLGLVFHSVVDGGLSLYMLKSFEKIIQVLILNSSRKKTESFLNVKKRYH